MSFEDVLSNGIPLHDASRFFISLKKLAAQPTEPPDETGALEGKFSVPVEQVLAAMGEQVRNEFETHMSYKVYAQTLRDLSHYAIAEHFEDHCGDEMDHADFLLRRMAALGGPANVPDVQAPFPSANPVDIIKKMIRMEQEAVANWRNLRQLVGDENPTSIAIDDYILKEQEHIDDLWQLLPHTERSAVVNESVGSAPPAPAPAQAPAQAPPTPAAQPATQPVASAEKTSSADLQKAAFAMKLAYYGGYYGGHSGYGSYGYSGYGPYASQMAQEAHDRGEVEALQGRMRMASADGRDAVGNEFIEDQRSSGQLGGGLIGATMGGLGLGALGYGMSGGKPVGALVGGLGGVGLGGLAGSYLGGKAGESHGRKLVDRAYAGVLPVDEPVKAVDEPVKAAEVRFKVAAAMLKQANELLLPEAGKALSDEQLMESGRRRAVMQLGADAAKAEALSGSRAGDVAGRVGGAAPGGGAGYGLARAVGASPAAQLAAIGGGALLGQGLGGRVGKHIGLQSDLAGLKEASLKMRFIKAAAELLDSATETPSPMASAPAEAMGGPGAPDANAGSFLEQEQMMQQAQDTNEANYYKKKFEVAQQSLQAAQQQQQAQQQQMDQMNQQLQSMQQQIDGSVQQNQQVQQQAMQNAQSAQAAATQAMQQTLAANSELLSQQQLSANMRNAYQQLQQQVMQVAQAAPPPATTMEAGASQAAAMGTPPQTGPGEMAGGAGGEPGTGAGQPGGDAGASAGPAAGPPPGDQGAAAPGGEQAAPPAPTSEGANMAPQGDQTAPQPEAAQAAKQGSANDLEKYLMLDGEKFASFLSDASSRVGDLAKQHAPAVIGAGIGAAGGAVLPFALTGGEEQLAALRQRVADRDANKDELGWRDELNQIKDKSMLGMEEFAQHHPVATHVMGALTGAGVGAVTGTAAGELLKSRKLDPAGY